jgi:hypothetical protein
LLRTEAPVFSIRTLSFEPVIGQRKKPILIGNDEIEIHPVPGEKRENFQVCLGEQPFLNEQFRADEKRVAGKR